jgi:hypothetical protein
MRYTKSLLCVAAMAFGLGVSAASAAQDQVANLDGCMKLSEQVKSALDSNQQSANFNDAKKQGTYGREFCTNGFYAKGMAHYQHALELLGVAEQGMAQKS